MIAKHFGVEGEGNKYSSILDSALECANEVDGQ